MKATTRTRNIGLKTIAAAVAFGSILAEGLMSPRTANARVESFDGGYHCVSGTETRINPLTNRKEMRQFQECLLPEGERYGNGPWVDVEESNKSSFPCNENRGVKK